MEVNYQLAVLTKEVYAIYMDVKKLTYITDNYIVSGSDNLPLKKFLHKVILNDKVNNWRAEISNYNIKFKFKIKILQLTLY